MNLLTDPVAPLLRLARVKRYAKGETVLYHGDQVSDMMVLAKGRIKIYDIDNQGNEKIIHILQEGAMFPLVYFLESRNELDWFYAAITDVEVSSIAYPDFERAMRTRGEFAMHVAKLAAIEIHELRVRVDSLGRATTTGKLLAALWFLSCYHCEKPRGEWRRVAFPVSHQLLADLVGTTRESVTIAMRQFHQDKIIRYPALTVMEIHTGRLAEFNV